MKYPINNKTWNYALVAVSIIVVVGLGTAYADTLGSTFEEFCEKITSDDRTDAADFICEVDIYQMESDIEEVKNISFASRTSKTDLITIPGQNTYSHAASCPDGTYITNVGYLRTDQIIPPITDSGLDLSRSFQDSNRTWILSFANPTDESIDVRIVFSCLG